MKDCSAPRRSVSSRRRPHRAGALPEDSDPASIAATLPVAIAALVRTRGPRAVRPDATLSTAADFLAC